jgi:hypothetical protein
MFFGNVLLLRVSHFISSGREKILLTGAQGARYVEPPVDDTSEVKSLLKRFGKI